MSRMAVRGLIAIALQFVMGSGTAVVGQPVPIVGLQIDQDVFFPPSEDKDYTMGLQVDLLRSRLGQRPLAWLDWPLGRLAHRTLATGRDAVSFHVGVSAFTPLKGEGGSVLAQTAPIPDDRPYASLVYGRARRTTWLGKNAFVTELTVGLLGTRLAEAVQTGIHRYISDDVDPGGWPNQISDGGEPTAAYAASYRRLLWGVDTVSFLIDGSPGDVMATLDASVGYYTNVRLGVQGRLGLVKSPWPTAGTAVSSMVVYVFPEAEPGEPLALHAADTAAACRCKLAPEEVYLWLNGGWTYWRYNALLQGGLKGGNPVELSFSPLSTAPMRRGVADVRFGVTARWRRAGATWTVVTRHSPLFDGPKSRFHSWGSFTLTIFR